MENLSDQPTTTQPSLLSLNEYCLLELFDFLKMEDAMRLAESCIYLKCVANRTFRKYSEIRLGERMAEKGKEYICRFITNFGHHVLSLKINRYWETLDWKIVKNCRNLKRLEILGQNAFRNVPTQFTVDNLEEFTLGDCYSKFVSGFRNIVRNTKSLNIIDCSIGNDALAAMFLNSPEIKSFLLDCSTVARFDFRLLEMISNVEKICLKLDFKNVAELDPLLKLNRLTKLALGCNGKNISSFLSVLAKKGIMQELELWRVAVDENFFEALKSFDTLQFLVLYTCYSNCKLTSLIIWPPKLKHLKLRHFRLTFDSFLSTMKQLKHLESINVCYCDISKGEKGNFIDVTKMSQRILNAIDNSDRTQRLIVVLPRTLMFKENWSKEYLVDSERLRILNTTLRIEMNFPGLEEW